MDLTFANGTGQQRQWVMDAIAHTKLRLDVLDEAVTVHFVADPPCAGHNDYMCTQETGPTADIHIRQTADSSSLATGATQGSLLGNDLKNFFMESVIHEIGHVFTFTNVTTDPDRTTLAAMFVHDEVAGNAPRTGVLADFNPLGQPWEERIQEAVAETIKDLYMPDSYRHYDNRTNWNLAEEHLGDFITMLKTYLETEVDYVSSGYSGVVPGVPTFHSGDGRYYAHFTYGASAGVGFLPVPAANRVLRRNFRAATGRLLPADILSDNGCSDTLVYVPFGGGGAYIPQDDQTWGAWAETDSDTFLSISDAGGTIGTADEHIDNTSAPDSEHEIDVNPGTRVPTTGIASWTGPVPDGFFKDVEGRFGTAGAFHGIYDKFAPRRAPIVSGVIPDPGWNGVEAPESATLPGEWPYSDPFVGLAQGFQATFRHRKP